MIRFEDFKSEDECLDFLQELKIKAENKQTISLDQQEFMCRCLNNDGQKAFTFCDDLRFKQLFLVHFDSSLKGGAMEKSEKDDLRDFVVEWESLMKKENHKEPLMNHLAVETRSELKKVLPNFSFWNRFFCRDDYQKRQHEIIGYSKFAYIKIKSIFTNIGRNSEEMVLNGNKIEVNEFTLAHIFMRHYAEQVRLYMTDDKSYFTEEVEIEQIPFVIRDIINAIEVSKFYTVDDFKDINVKYKNRDYKIYCIKYIKQIKGKGNIETNRVNTFYPIELHKDLENLKNYELKRMVV